MEMDDWIAQLGDWRSGGVGMKRVLTLAIALGLLLGMAACSKAGRIPSLNEIAENGAEWGMEQLRQIPDCTLADLEKEWGEAAGELHGEYAYFWQLEDETSINVHYCRNAEIEYITLDVKIADSEEAKGTGENSLSDTIYWEFTPLLSSRRPALAFSFDVPCQEIAAECDSGSLVDFDHSDEENMGYPQGKSLSVPGGSRLYWSPFDGEVAESVAAASAELTFSVTDESGTVLYHGTLNITEREKTQHGILYSASLVLGSGLTLAQNESQSGGVLSENGSKPDAQQPVPISVAQTGGDAAALSEADSRAIQQILDGGSWADYGTDCASDCVISLEDRTISYHSECGTFNERVGQTERSLSLLPSEQNAANELLEKYISLGGLDGIAPLIKEVE